MEGFVPFLGVQKSVFVPHKKLLLPTPQPSTGSASESDNSVSAAFSKTLLIPKPCRSPFPFSAIFHPRLLSHLPVKEQKNVFLLQKWLGDECVAAE